MEPPSYAYEKQRPYNQKKWTTANTIAATIWILIFIIIFVFILEIAWNNTMPHIFNVGAIDFWQSLLLLILVRILFPPNHMMMHA